MTARYDYASSPSHVHLSMQFYNPDSAVIREETPIYMGWFFFIGVCAFFGQLGMWSLFAYSGEKLTRRLRVATYRAVMRQEMVCGQA